MGWPSACRLDQTLEFRPAVAGCRNADVNECLDKLMPMRGAPGFALLTLIRDGDVMLCLPRRRDTKVKRDPLGRAVAYGGHGFGLSIRAMGPNISSKTSPK